MDAQSVIKGAKATAPVPNPTRAGYTFAGWFTEEACTHAFDFATEITADITLYAKWDAKDISPDKATTHMVRFDAAGGAPTPSAQEVVNGEKATAPEVTPELEGYTFLGWWLTDTDQFDFDKMVVTNDITLTAKWAQNATPDVPVTTYTITYHENGGTPVGTQTIESGKYAPRPTDPARTGYVFDGWFTQDGTESGNWGEAFDFEGTAITESRDLYAKWSEKPWERLAGSNRYDTNAKLVESGFSEKGGTVILATGENFPDALSASGLAGLCDAPLLLTGKNELPTEVKAQLNRLAPSKIYIMGSENSVSASVEREAKSMLPGVSVTRIGGTNRFETALMAYETGKSAGTWGDTAIVTWCDGFADALSAAPVAWSNNYPVFLTDGPTATLSAEAIKAIKEGGFKRVLFLGGTNRVAESVKSDLAGIECVRLSGSNRMETSVRIAEWAHTNTGASYDNIVVATASKFPDALGGGALAGKRNTVLVLAEDSQAGLYAADEIVAKNASDIISGTFLGDTNSISARVATYFEEAAKE